MEPYNNQRLERLAVRLFKEFSRFEYALKATTFHSGNGDAKPDWRRFALSVEEVLARPTNEPLRGAVEYILSHPPKKQVIRNGFLDWEDSAPSTDSQADRIRLYVRRVRNNLFHGGKFNGRWLAPERSEALLRHSLVILKACRAASHEIAQAYQR